MDPSNEDGFFTKIIQTKSLDEVSMMTIPSLAQDANRAPLQISARGSTKKTRGDNYSDEEDIIIVNGWLAIGPDGIVGTEQKFDKLWDRIHAYYHECKKPSHQERSKHSLNNRWSTIRCSVNKFCACLNQIEILNPSGKSEADKQPQVIYLRFPKIEDAETTYKDDWGTNFTFNHCWKILRYHPKWILLKEEARKKKKKGASGSQAAHETIDIGDKDVPTTMDECERPAGRKALKAGEKKRKYKEEKAALFEKVVSGLKEERKQQHEEKMQKIDKLSQIEEKKVAQKDRLVTIAEKKLVQEEEEKENQIMLMDISRLDAVQQEYVQKLRQKILQNMHI